VAFVEARGVGKGRALEIGSGTGTNAIWLAEHGFDVLGLDVSTLAVDEARTKAGARPRVRFEVRDFVTDPVTGPFDFVFDRGTWHVFDEPEDRARFAAHVAAALTPEGRWLSLIGSTEGGDRESGPPRRSARDVAEALEPVLEILELRTFDFVLPAGVANAWACVSRRRPVPAVASTRRT
jgi:SAM-dependent methyltransferase